MKKIFYSVASLILVSTALTSCSQDSLEPGIKTEIDLDKEPITTVARLEMILNGAYKNMQSVSYYGRDYVIYNEVRSDNAHSVAYSGRFLNETDFRTTISSAYASDTWVSIYKVIALANIAINANINANESIDDVNELKAQAYALRALAHFDLMKLYGQQNVTDNTSSLTVPYITAYGVVTAENSYRLTLSELKTALEADIEAATSLVSNSISVKNKLNRQSILAIKARIAMYMAPFFGQQEYATALTASQEAYALGGAVISEGQFLSSFASGNEAMNSVFELTFLDNDNLGNNSIYNMYGYTAYGDILAANNVADVLLADTNDVRSQLLAVDRDGDLRNLGKYTSRASNVKVVRFEEIVLNIAETAFRTGDTNTALEFINKIAENRGIAAYTTVTLESILNERRKELVFEGFRFDDLMRTQSNIPAISERQAANTPSYGDYRLAFPIPQFETNVSPIQQNQGY